MQQQEVTMSPVLLPVDILTLKELAARLKVKPTWIYEKIRQRIEDPFPALHCGRYLRFSWPAVSAWLLRQKPKPHRRRKAGRA